MNEITRIYENKKIRIIEENGETFFVGKDVCGLLGYKNPNKAMNDHCKGITKSYPLLTDGGIQELRVLSEPDVMRLVCGSHLPDAVRFEKWVFEEVLPEIRKTGSYGIEAAIRNDIEQKVSQSISGLIESCVERSVRKSIMEHKMMAQLPFPELNNTKDDGIEQFIKNYVGLEFTKSDIYRDYKNSMRRGIASSPTVFWNHVEYSYDIYARSRLGETKVVIVPKGQFS